MSDQTAQPEAQSVSTVLSTRREALGLTQREVADALFLAPTIISHIDEGRFDKLPNPAYIKGYLRSYARLVEVDGDRIVAAYEAEYDHPEEPELRDVSDEEVGPAAITGPVLTTGLAGLGVTVILVIFVWWIVGSDEEPVQEIPPAQDMNDVMEAMPTAQVTGNDAMTALNTGPGDRAGSISDVDGAVPAQANPDDITAAERTEDRVADDFADGDFESTRNDDAVRDRTSVELSAVAASPSFDVQIDRRAEAGVRYVDVVADGADQLLFTFTDECWLKVSDADGRQLYADLNGEGDVLSIRGKGHFTILLGRGSVVAIRFNDEAIDVAPYIRDDETARIRTQYL